MNTANKTSRILGVAFLLQFITSFTSGVFLKPTWFVEGDMAATMLKIAQSPLLMRTGFLLDMLTALGVTFLGVVLYLTLRKQNETLALTAMLFYVLEGALHAAGKLDAFSLLRLSQEYAATGQPAQLLFMGQVAYDAMSFVSGTLMMAAFCPGAILFYFLLYRSGVVPRWLSLWGLITTFPMLVGTITQIFGYSIPFGFYVPYVPFEFVIGLWILIKGIPESNS
ncbi:MAG: DUF4386 domain-containing protein [Anaerolineae bacterium]